MEQNWSLASKSLGHAALATATSLTRCPPANAGVSTGTLFSTLNAPTALKTIYQQEGMLALFAGIGPRVGWITAGGFVFFGAYEKAQEMLWTTGGWGAKPKFQM